MFGSIRDLTFNHDARQELLKGVILLEKAVSATLGPSGRNVIIERGWSDSRITKDGVTVANELFVEDKLQNIGMQILKTVARKTAEDAGDGTTTSTILGRHIFEQGLQYTEDENFNATKLKKELMALTKELVEKIKEISLPVGSDPKKLSQIATISANNDEEVGELISEIYTKMPNGEVMMENSPNERTYVEVHKGATFEQSYIDTMFYDQGNKHTKDYENALIVVSNLKVQLVSELKHLVEKAIANGQAFVLICEELTGEALEYMIFLATKKELPVVAVWPPGIANMRRHMLKDLAIITGGTFIDRNQGHALEQADLEHLGTSAKVRVTRNNVIITGGGGSPEEVEDRKLHIQDEVIPGCPDPSLADRHKERLNKLFGGIAKVFVGAATEFERKEKYDRIEDAILAAKSAKEMGIVPGAGSVYNTLAKDLPDTVAGRILKTALEAPLIKLLTNAGLDIDTVQRLVKEVNLTNGYNGLDNTEGDLIKSGIIDPTKVIIKALENAVSVASTLLLTDVVVNYKEHDMQSNIPVQVKEQ